MACTGVECATTQGCIGTQTVFAVLHPVGITINKVLLGSNASALHTWLGLCSASQVLGCGLLLAGLLCFA